MYTATTFPICCPFLHPDRIQRIHQWRLRVAKSRRHSSSKHCHHHQQPASSSSSTSASEGTPPPRRRRRTSRRRCTEEDEGYEYEGSDRDEDSKPTVALHDDSASSYYSSWSSEDDDNDNGDDEDDDDQLHHPIIDLLPDPEHNPLTTLNPSDVERAYMDVLGIYTCTQEKRIKVQRQLQPQPVTSAVDDSEPSTSSTLFALAAAARELETIEAHALDAAQYVVDYAFECGIDVDFRRLVAVHYGFGTKGL